MNEITDNNFPWDNLSADSLYEIHNDKCFFKINPRIIDADPFLFVHNEELFLFYEEKRLNEPGVLKMTKTKDLKEWTSPIIVLKEPFHLSYPFVFKEGCDIYMVPETSAVNEVRLYKAADDTLSHFVQVTVLLKNGTSKNIINNDFSDSSIVKFNSVFYLFTTQEINGLNTLRLYVSMNIKGPYLEHPHSPICKSKKHGRNGGQLLFWGDKLYRFAQDCTKKYGDNVHVLEIKELTPESYKEVQKESSIFNNEMDFYSQGGHQFNYTFFNNKLIVATDAKEYHRFLGYIIKRVLRS